MLERFARSPATFNLLNFSFTIYEHTKPSTGKRSASCGTRIGHKATARYVTLSRCWEIYLNQLGEKKLIFQNTSKLSFVFALAVQRRDVIPVRCWLSIKSFLATLFSSLYPVGVPHSNKKPVHRLTFSNFLNYAKTPGQWQCLNATTARARGERWGRRGRERGMHAAGKGLSGKRVFVVLSQCKDRADCGTEDSRWVTGRLDDHCPPVSLKTRLFSSHYFIF